VAKAFEIKPKLNSKQIKLRLGIASSAGFHLFPGMPKIIQRIIRQLNLKCLINVCLLRGQMVPVKPGQDLLPAVFSHLRHNPSPAFA
jgi:hypothetical protein